MKQKIVNLIMEILKGSNELKSFSIASELEERRCEITHDTLSKYLKKMTEQGVIRREAKGNKDHTYYDNRKHWVFYYSLE